MYLPYQHVWACVWNQVQMVIDQGWVWGGGASDVNVDGMLAWGGGLVRDHG